MEDSGDNCRLTKVGENTRTVQCIGQSKGNSGALRSPNSYFQSVYSGRTWKASKR